MAALGCSEETISTILEHCHVGGDLSVSVLNGPRSLCVSGASNDINQLGNRQTAKYQSHSIARESGLPQFPRRQCCHWVARVVGVFLKSFQPLRTTLYSTLLGAPILKGNTLAPHHWRRSRHWTTNGRLVSAPANGCSATSTIALSAKKDDDQEISLLSALAALYQTRGITPDFRALYAQYEQQTPLTTTFIPHILSNAYIVTRRTSHHGIPKVAGTGIII
ncbi:hypothetical protein B0H14DRAFT_3171272 [Mycena olivaceomarginata]|nr:hypothetical protein B0H14DRAFT_3171272 [Mycena olivaceomarginata]